MVMRGTKEYKVPNLTQSKTRQRNNLKNKSTVMKDQRDQVEEMNSQGIKQQADEDESATATEQKDE
jgi:hypothetical protein